MAHPSPGVANPYLPTKGLRNILLNKADESFPEEVKVVDRRHPLYGQAFRVMRRLPFHCGNSRPSYEVEYRHGVTLLVPVAATEHPTDPDGLTKLSINALYDLLNVVECRYHDEHRTQSSLVDTAAEVETTGRRRSRRSSRGGLL